jgi:hypothetical protein
VGRVRTDPVAALLAKADRGATRRSVAVTVAAVSSLCRSQSVRQLWSSSTPITTIVSA